MGGKFRMLYYVNQEQISYAPSSYWHYRGTNQANRAVLMAVGSHTGTTAACGFADRLHLCVCIVYVCVLTVTRCLCMFPCAEIDSFRTFLSWFSKARWALDHPKLRAPKIEPWFHPLHRSGPPSSSTPAPHTVSITRALRITLWHKTRVCSLHDWARSIYEHIVQLREIWECFGVFV